MTINRRINANAEAMLVILSQSARTDDISPVGGLALIDVDDRYNTGGAGFDDDTAGLVELVGENVLIIRKSNDELDHKLAATSHDCPAGAPIGVLPVDAVVLLVNADDIWRFLAFAVWLDNDAI